jgi:hypothetical protein
LGQHDHGTAQTAQDRTEEAVGLVEFLGAQAQFLVDGLQFVVGGLELFVGGLQFLVQGLEFFVGSPQLGVGALARRWCAPVHRGRAGPG